MEKARLTEARNTHKPWKKWGPYLSERQWGTVREDYSENGDAWNYFPHDHARSRAYKWGEDGLGGISDDKQRLCFALALWNEHDPIIKERLFGLINSEGNHGEDVKEYYFYLDSTPTHSYMKFLYKYPQRAYPYLDLINKNKERGRSAPEYELLDTDAFAENRYFDVFVEYAKAGPEDILIRITAVNRGPDAAPLHIDPTLWYRNTWQDAADTVRPSIRQESFDGNVGIAAAVHPDIGTYLFCAERPTDLLFTENETNTQRLFNTPNPTPYVKDGIHNFLVNHEPTAVNPARTGTKAAAHYALQVGAGASVTVRLRLVLAEPEKKDDPWFGKAFDDTFADRIAEADAFYADLIPSRLGEDGARVMRQALAGMLWSKQYFYYDVRKWLGEHGIDPSTSRKPDIRNAQWHHMRNADVISMPDKWEYPWYAAWDLAFHTSPLMLVDPDFAKAQLELMLSVRYQHPNGQLPAYEWNFGDVNPPVHAWATISNYFLENSLYGKADRQWLERCFHKLLLNFSWWVNRKDREGSNLFEGGFLGLDNIGVFDRSAPLPNGGKLEQADGTAWMALFCQNMIEIGTQLAQENPAYVNITLKLIAHFLEIASAMMRPDEDGSMWDEQDGFFYDLLVMPDGKRQRMKVRSMVGLLPLCAVTVFEGDLRTKYPEIPGIIRDYLKTRPELSRFIHDPTKHGRQDRLLASLLNEQNLRRILGIMLDEHEFLSPFGIRALSRVHRDHPYVFHTGDQTQTVSYLPGESDNAMFGGNSNWRGPIWMPVNMIIVRALMNYYLYYGDEFKIECPTGSGRMMTLYQVAEEITRRLSSIFLRDASGQRPVYANDPTFQHDPEWRDYILFFEYFHGDTGQGLGASHQTGWTGTVARAMHMFAHLESDDVITLGKDEMFAHVHKTAPPGRQTLKEPERV